MTLDINVTKAKGTTTLVLSGQVTAVTAPAFDKAVSDNLPGTALLVIDFKDCPYVSSAGLRILMKAFQTLETAGGRMKLTQVGDVFMDVLENTYLDDVFDIERVD